MNVWKVHYAAGKSDSGWMSSGETKSLHMEGVLTLVNAETPEQVLDHARGILQGMLHLNDILPANLVIYKIERTLDDGDYTKA